MKLCGEACVAMCDFCKYMKQYAEDEDNENFGVCTKLNEEVKSLHDFCEDFHCIRSDK